MTSNWCTSFGLAAPRPKQRPRDWGRLGALASLAWPMIGGTCHAWQVHNIDGQCQLKVVAHLLKCLSAALKVERSAADKGLFRPSMNTELKVQSLPKAASPKINRIWKYSDAAGFVMGVWCCAILFCLEWDLGLQDQHCDCDCDWCPSRP